MWKRLIESFFLLGAIALLIPIPPSNPSAISFFPSGAFAGLLFLVSRLLRNAGKGSISVIVSGGETLTFLLIAYFANESANILLDSHKL